MLDYRSNHLLGLIFIVISAFADATLPIFGKLAFANGLHPSTVLFLRNGFSFVIIAVYLALVKRSRVISISPATLVQSLLLITSEIAYLYSLKNLSADIATVLFYTYPILVTVLASVFFKERLTKAIVIGLALAFGGILLLSGITGHSIAISTLGFLLALLSSCGFVAFCLIGQKTVHRVDSLQLTATFSLVGVIVVSILFPAQLAAIPYLNSSQLLIGLGTAVCNNLLGILFFLKAVHKIGASKASLGCTLEPALTLLLAYIVLGEILTPIEALGVSLIIGSIILTFPRAKGQAGKVAP